MMLCMNKIFIEVAFATKEKQVIIPLHVEANTSVLDAIALSGIAKHFPNYGLDKADHTTPIGIFGKKVNPIIYQLREKDRIEIYRPLNKTPNQKRLERIK